MTTLQKPILSPFIVIVFLVISVTGALLFFHVKNGTIVTLHEWSGWVFVAVGCVHVFINRNPLFCYLKTPKGRIAMLVAVCLAIVLGVVGVNRKGGPGPHGSGGPPSLPNRQGPPDGP